MNKGISKLQLDGKAVENATDIAEQFNSYFSSIADNLRSGLESRKLDSVACFKKNMFAKIFKEQQCLHHFII